MSISYSLFIYHGYIDKTRVTFPAPMTCTSQLPVSLVLMPLNTPGTCIHVHIVIHRHIINGSLKSIPFAKKISDLKLFFLMYILTISFYRKDNICNVEIEPFYFMFSFLLWDYQMIYIDQILYLSLTQTIPLPTHPIPSSFSLLKTKQNHTQ